jgi:hypothetical protein
MMTGNFMPSLKALLLSALLALLWVQTAAAQGSFGPQGAEGEPDRAQARTKNR